jgi:hypothetical protein
MSAFGAKPTSLGIISMEIDEVEIYVTADGLGRAAIVRRNDGLLCIYEHWILSEDVRKALGIVGKWRTNWLTEEKTPLSDLYEGVDPQTGIYGTLDDARRQLKSLPGFSESQLLPPE